LKTFAQQFLLIENLFVFSQENSILHRQIFIQIQNGNRMQLPLLEEMNKEMDQINSLALTVSMLMIIKRFILLTGEMIVLLHGNLIRRMVKSLQVNMEEGIELIS
jgi:hypothetical protein